MLLVLSGTFVHDAYVDLQCWNPTHNEMIVLSTEFMKFVRQNHKIERLCVKKSLALEMFKDNPFKVKQIPSIAANSEGKLKFYFSKLIVFTAIWDEIMIQTIYKLYVIVRWSKLYHLTDLLHFIKT